MSEALPVDAVALRDEVRVKYRDVAVNPRGTFHFHTGQALARRLGYDEDIVVRMPESAIEAFAGVGNPFSESKARLFEVFGYAFLAENRAYMRDQPVTADPFSGRGL